MFACLLKGDGERFIWEEISLIERGGVEEFVQYMGGRGSGEGHGGRGCRGLEETDFNHVVMGCTGRFRTSKVEKQFFWKKTEIFPYFLYICSKI